MTPGQASLHQVVFFTSFLPRPEPPTQTQSKMDESTPIQLTEIIDKLRIRATGNDKWVNILVQNDTDLRARRIMQLLGEATPKAEAVCALIEQILQICENSQVFHRGYDPYLLSLRQEITEAANYHTEILRRTRLYLQLMAKKESSFSEDILCSMDSAVAEQQELANHLRFESYRLLGTAVSRPPGPAITAFNAQRDTTDLPEVQMRPLFDNKPLPIEDEYDSRWDPDFRVPGSQYGKFLRFHGPFFAPDEEGASTCDNFNLPESAGLIIDACISKYEAVKNNFEETGRLPRKTQQSSIQALVSHQRVCHFLDFLMCFTDESA